MPSMCRSALWLALPVLTILSLPAGSQQSPADRIQTGLIAEYPLDEGTGTTAQDKQNGPEPMQLVGTLSWLPGRNGVSFPGTPNPFGRPMSLLVEPATRLQEAITAAGAFTFDIWFRSADSSRVFRAGFAGLTVAADRNFSIESSVDGTRVYLATSATAAADRLVLLAPRPPVDAVEHLTVTFDKSTVVLYRNGERVASEVRTGDLTGWNAALPLMLGSLPSSPAPWRGEVFGVALYSRALSAAEVSSNYQAGSSPVPLFSEVRGRVVDPFGMPVGGANIIVERAAAGTPEVVARTVSAADGSFVVRVTEGAYRLCITLGKTAVCARQFVARGAAPLDVGAIPIGVDAGDLDGDGLSDDLERMGWSVFVDEHGTGELTERRVTSDPAETDTDQDGLSDRMEFAMKTDPRARDTDGDLLSDLDELDKYKSNPVSVDTDGDSRGPRNDQIPNPALFDGIELMRSKTSPTLADTDGDGLTDYQEIIGGGFNPLRADLPEWNLQTVGNPSITLNISTKTTTGEQSVTSRLQRDQASQSQTDSTSTRMSMENTQTISTEASVSGPPLGGSAKVSASAEFKQGLVSDTAASFTRDSVRESQQQFQTELQNVSEQEFQDGTIKVAMRFRNTSELSFKMKDLSVVAFRLAPQVTGAFSVLGTLKPETSGTVILGPGADHLFVAQATDINPLEISQLLRNPTSILFEVGGFSVFQTDQLGNETKDFAVVAQDVVERCGLIVIDYEDGRVERHFVATNVLRNSDGSGAGITLGEALRDVLRLDFETQEKQNDKRQRILSRIRDRGQFGAVEDMTRPPDLKPRGYWAVIGNGRDFEPTLGTNGLLIQSTKNFDQILLHSGERVSLVYLTDSDGDRLTDREERLRGTNLKAGDSDGDTLGDHFETKTGWDVKFATLDGKTVDDYTRHVFSDARFADADGDGLEDDQEFELGTDPNLPDTDGDGLSDKEDRYPLDAPVIRLPRTGLLSHYRFDRTDSDLRTGRVLDSSGFFDLTAASYDFPGTPPSTSTGYSGAAFNSSAITAGLHDLGDRFTSVTAPPKAVYFSQLSASNSTPAQERYAVAELRKEVIPMGRPFSVAVWLYARAQPARASGLEGVVVEQEGWTSLVIEPSRTDGTGPKVMRFWMQRAAGGGTDSRGLDDCGRAGNACFELRSDTWTFYVATFDGGNMRLYRDGSIVNGPSSFSGSPLPEYLSSTWFRIAASTRTLNPPVGPLCKGTPRPGDPRGLCTPGFQGGVDDLRIYNRALSDVEVIDLYRERGFRP